MLSVHKRHLHTTGREMQAQKIYLSWITSGILPDTLNHHWKKITCIKAEGARGMYSTKVLGHSTLILI